MFATLPDRWKLILQLALVALLLVSLGAVVAYLIKLNPVLTSRSVRFKVEAAGGYSIITLQAGELKIAKPTTVTTPWQRVVEIKSGSAVYLTASNPTQTGTLSCSISLEEMIWKMESTSAPKDGVACAGIVP